MFINIPGFTNIGPFPGSNPAITGPTATLGSIVSSFAAIGFSVAGFFMFVWAAIGVFQYITAQGKKEELAKARAKITWALVGFLLLIISFSFSLFVQNLSKAQNINVQTVGQCTTAQLNNCRLGNPRASCVLVGTNPQCR